MAPIVTGFEDDVSSYGVEEDRLLSQKPEGDDDVDVEPEPVSFRQSKRDGRRTSFADPLLTSRDQIPARHLPSKSPRMRKPDDRRSSSKRSPPRNSSRGPAHSRNRRDDEEDDDSNTQDPTATINEHGGATPDDKESSSPRRAVPIRDSDEEQEKALETPQLSHNSPKKRKRKVSQPSIFDDDLWVDPVELNPPKRRTHMDWTEDEADAVREGYKKFGKRWALIKQNCQHRLSRRTNVQIKDKWRTMVKAGEIEQEP